MKSLKEDDTRFVDITKLYKRFVDIIHFTEDMSTRIQGLRSESKIFNAIKNAFTESKDYSSVILKIDIPNSTLEKINQAILDRDFKEPTVEEERNLEKYRRLYSRFQI